MAFLVKVDGEVVFYGDSGVGFPLTEDIISSGVAKIIEADGKTFVLMNEEKTNYADLRNKAARTKWPELMNEYPEKAIERIKRDRLDLEVVQLNASCMATMDFWKDHVRAMVDGEQ